MPGMPGIHVFHMGGGGGPGPIFQGGFADHLFEQFNKPPPIIKNIQITLENAYVGGNFYFDIERIFIRNGLQIQETEKMQIEIPRGIQNGDILIKRGCGNCNENLSGDLKLIIEILPHPDFQRIGNDLIYKREITLKDALCGLSFEFTHLNKKLIQMNNQTNPVIIVPNYKKTIPNLGMILQDHITGNLIIEFEIMFPETLTPKQIQSLKELL
jgi:DnaJ family protein B protein 4